jgi:hypothetical protein
MSHPHDEAAVLGIKRIFAMSTEVETSLTWFGNGDSLRCLRVFLKR